MNPDLEKVKLEIAAVFCQVNSVESALSSEQELHEFVSEACRWAIENITDFENSSEFHRVEEDDCLRCKYFVGCDFNKIAFHKQSGISCDLYET